MPPIQKIAVLTSGGDAPGMNAAVWALIKLASSRRIHVIGVEGGYDGLIDGVFQELTRDLDGGGMAPVGGLDWLAGTGGTFLGSSRSQRFRESEGRAEASSRMRGAGIDALVVIGGNGSLTGAHLLANEGDIPIVGIPASIDNDIGGTTDAIGVDTALNTIIEACDRVSDTARSHHRAFVLEVMGRKSGYLAMASAVAATADAVLLPERPREKDELLDHLEELLRSSFSADRDKRRVLIVKAEGVPTPTLLLADQLQERVNDLENVTVRAIVLGHLVRGGHPTFHDRMIAGRLALGAIDALTAGSNDIMVGWLSNIGEKTQDTHVSVVPLSDMLTETDRLLDGTSDVTKMRMNLIAQVEGVLAL